MEPRPVRKILVIDDEEKILKAVRLAFDGKFEVLCAQSGESGLELIRKEAPSFIFLDIVMPGMSGLAVLEAIQSLGSTAVVWMLTGSQELETIECAMRGGARGYITKPFKIDQLRSLVADAAEKLDRPSGAGDKPWRVKKRKQ